MTYWRTSRALSGGQPAPGSPHRAVTLRELKSLPPLPSGAIFKPAEFSEPPVDEFQAFESAFLGIATFMGLVAAFVLLFVDLG